MLGAGHRQAVLMIRPRLVASAAVGRADLEARGDRRTHRRHGATTFAMESVCDAGERMADRGGYDIRLEAAAAKEWNTVRGWEIVDQTLQIRGGRGYETERSLPGAASTRSRRAHDARLPHQPHLRGLERDHAPLHGPRGRGQAPEVAGP
jgi:hypothetical protein